jgi:hypothetical protein
MTQYMFMLFDDESWHDNMTEQDWAEGMQAHRAFAEAVDAAGARVLDGNALEHTRTATTVRNSGGSEGPLTTDGPFIETKEAIGGYYVIEARDLDLALELAAKCPSPIVEVRPVLDTSGGAGDASAEEQSA